MVTVITYGTYDLLHYGHIRLLERAKALGDYLIVGVTSDDFDRSRGKINVRQSLVERMEAVRATGLADQIIVEEYEGQKIDDILKYNVDIFTVGSDWKGKFDYLNEYCKVVYLDRTEGISSSEIRSQNQAIRLGVVGESPVVKKVIEECKYVNGVEVSAVFSRRYVKDSGSTLKGVNSFSELLTKCDAVYLVSEPTEHYEQIKEALSKGVHVLCESPITLRVSEYEELESIAKEKNVVLMEAIKTAYSTAFNRMILLAKSGKIGKIVSINVTCTSLRDIDRINKFDYANLWSSIFAWGPTALLPIFQLFGLEYIDKMCFTLLKNEFDLFTKIVFYYSTGVASIEVGKGVKSEGCLVISGTNGYIYVPAPWWITDYFELKYENSNLNKRYFYQLDGEGIRQCVLSFITCINNSNIVSDPYTKSIIKVMEDYAINHKYSIIKSE